MKNNLIIITLLLTNVIGLSGYPVNRIQDNKTPVKVEMFLKKHFAKYEIDKLKHDAKDGKCKVKYTNGYKIEFDGNSNWIEIESSYQPLPKSIIDLLPQKALSYISQNYPRKIILKIKRKSKGYKVVLLEAPNLLFDKNGHFLEKD